MEKQLVELQTQFSFQEDLLLELNKIVIRQQTQIDSLQQQLSICKLQLSELLSALPAGEGSTVSDERPPHY